MCPVFGTLRTQAIQAAAVHIGIRCEPGSGHVQYAAAVRMRIQCGPGSWAGRQHKKRLLTTTTMTAL